MSIRYCEYNASRSIRNVVVDGSPNESTVLTLTHWPGISQPDGTQADLSAQMAFRFVRSGQAAGAEVVTNNHFDQDGLVAMFALADSEAALRHEHLLTDVAAAGDFATYRYRQAARASMAIWTYAHPERSPIASQLTGNYESQCAVLYTTMLELVLTMSIDPGRFYDLWAEEDNLLTASEAAVAAGSIAIREVTDIDLAVVNIADDQPQRSGHRFAANTFTGVHPMAINNATGCFRILQVHGRHYTYTDRYESWVQYRSRRPLPRVDMRPLADELTAAEPGEGIWEASSPSALTPQLWSPTESRLDPTTVLDRLTTHLLTAPPAWNPYAAVGAADVDVDPTAPSLPI